MICHEVTASSTLREFFTSYYLPRFIENAGTEARNLEGYRRAITLWEELVGNPPLDQASHETMSQFKSRLLAWEFAPGRRFSTNTVRKHLSHVYWVLEKAGPRYGRNLRLAAGLIPDVPYTKLPKARRAYRAPADDEHIVRLYLVADSAQLPRVEGVTPGAMWRALIATMASTGLRIGQLNATPMSALRFDQQMLVLPSWVCQKSKREEAHPLHSFAVARLLAIRTDRALLFPFYAASAGSPRAAKRTGSRLAPHAKRTIYDELHRLQDLAGVPHFGFHCIRRRVITSLSKISSAAAQLAAGHSSYETTKLYQGIEVLSDAVHQLGLFAEFERDTP